MDSPKIIVIDETKKDRTLVTSIFAPLGYRVIELSDSSQALNILANENPDLVLLEIAMSGLDGFQLCKTIKNVPVTADIPVIFLTAETDEKSLVEAFDCGAADYVQKPFNTTELVARVQTHVNTKRANDKFKLANATRDKFFLIISHDLKNPFNSVLMNSNLLKSRYHMLEEELRLQLVDGIQTSVENIYNLLDNLLEWAKRQLGKLNVIKEPIDLYRISQEVVALYSGQAVEKNLTIQNNIPLETMAYADAYMITLVFRNLVSNAVKFSRNGGLVKLACLSSDDLWEVTVSDQGVGISPDNIDRLFKLDVHHSTYGTKKEKGAGLGLILSREFIKDNGGDIHVRSTPDCLTEFIFTLPVLDNTESRKSVSYLQN